jgi:hypothetical protein
LEPISKLPLNVSFITKIASRPFYTQKPSKIFACCGHVSGSGYDYRYSGNKTLGRQSISKLPLKFTFMTKLLPSIFTRKNPKNF